MNSLWLDTRGTPAATDPWGERTASDVLVVGAGLTGLTTALLLARAGRSVSVIEARQVGALTTGHTTAKLSLLQGSVLSGVRRHAGPEAMQAYVAGHRAAQGWVVDYLGGADADGVVLQQRDAVTYACTPLGEVRVKAEAQACREAGLDVAEGGPGDGSDVTGLPYEVRAGLRLADQWQLHPVRVLDRLTDDLRALGGTVVEGVRMTGLQAGDPCTVRTTMGELTAATVVLATGTPVLDRGIHFAQLEPQRSYAAAYRGVPTPPQVMALSVDTSARSLRTASANGEEFLVVGGPGHTVGRHGSPASLVAELDEWTRSTFPGAELTHRWSAQDYRSADRMPFAGPVTGTHGRVLAGTGLQKWGMTGGVAAALAMTEQVAGPGASEVGGSWVGAFAGHGLGVSRAVEIGRINAAVGLRMQTGWLGAELSGLPEEAPAEGTGVVGRGGDGSGDGSADGSGDGGARGRVSAVVDAVRPVAVSTVDGVTREVSAVCTHLGGIVRWNDAECTWDCPLHGSRFSPDGTRLEGPATSDLSPR